MHGDDKIDQRADKEDPGPEVSIGFKSGEEANAADDEKEPTYFIKYGVDYFPAKLGFQVFPTSRQVVQTGTISEHVWHVCSSCKVVKPFNSLRRDCKKKGIYLIS